MSDETTDTPVPTKPRRRSKAKPKPKPVPAVKLIPRLSPQERRSLLLRARQLHGGFHVPHPGQPSPSTTWGLLEEQAKELAKVAKAMRLDHEPREHE